MDTERPEPLQIPQQFDAKVAKLRADMDATGIRDVHDVLRKLAFSMADTPTERLAMWNVLSEYVGAAMKAKS